MHFLAEYGLFLAQTLTLVFALLITVAGILALTKKAKPEDQKLSLENLNEKYDDLLTEMNRKLMPKSAYKVFRKQLKARKAQYQKDLETEVKKRIFVIDFVGDLKASSVASLREQISLVLLLANKHDEVLIKVDSAGGIVHGYGLAAAQLARIRRHDIPLTVAIDKIAASGGYLMSVVADKIIASPFAIIGSIGVVMQLPNFHRLMKKHNVDFELLTAGKYKRTLTVFGENTTKGREKMQEDLEQIHQAFQHFINKFRPQVDLDTVATGEIWLGEQALGLNLVDKLQTSDDYLLSQYPETELYAVNVACKKTLVQKITQGSKTLFNDIVGYGKETFLC